MSIEEYAKEHPHSARWSMSDFRKKATSLFDADAATIMAQDADTINGQELVAVNGMNRDVLEKIKSNKFYLMRKFVKFSYDQWRKSRLKPDGTYEPKLKKSTDDKWNKEHRTDYVDIANTEYEDLPRNRQYERMAAASVAIDLVLD
jgi:hypothetical protein